jgi:hypothetical protein
VLGKEGKCPMGEIVEHDFGKDDREHARRFARLLNLAERAETDILADPVKHIQLAAHLLAEKEDLINRLRDALRIPWMVDMAKPMADEPPDLHRPETVVIDRRDYEALQTIKGLLRSP